MSRLTLCIALLLLISSIYATNPAGKKFLADNASKQGVITLPSGLQYKVLKQGAGDSHPTIDSSCDCHYAGTLIDGTEFDSSYKRGSTTAFAPNQVIKGWTEAMQLMVEGDKWEMYIPSELAYGENGSSPKIKAGDALIFQMELVKINGKKKLAMKCDISTLTGCSDRDIKYIDKFNIKSWDLSKLENEIKRLDSMKNNNMKSDLLDWINRRVVLLNLVKKTHDVQEKEL